MFKKTVSNLNRISEVINILVKYSFEDIVSNTALRKFVQKRSLTTLPAGEKAFYEYTRWERVRMVIEELGTTFIKLAQFLSNRPDILPESLILEFSKLQNNVPPFSSKQAKEIIEKETGKRIDELFLYFDNHTIGSASIGQVHRARLKGGEDVVVKVQRPEARKKVHTDMILLRELVKLTENYFKGIGILNPQELVDAFEDSMRKELDYLEEARSIQQFKNVYKRIPELRIPLPYRDLTTSRILVMEFISGCEISNTQQLKDWGLEPVVVFNKFIHIYLNQIFKYGLFHADPHPGNILVYPNGIISLIDFGLVGKLTEKEKYNFAGILTGLATQNAKMMANNLRRLTKNEIDDMQVFENELQELIDDFVVLDVDEVGMTELTTQIQRIIFKYQLRITGSIFMILRALAIIEGVGRNIAPHFRILNYIKPYGRKIIRNRYSPKNIKSELQFSASQLFSLLYTSPIELKYILRKTRRGELKFNYEIIGFDSFLKKLDNVVNRLVLGLIIAALLVSAAIITLSPNHGNTILGFPVGSFICFSMAFFLSVWFIIYAIKNRMRL